MATPTRSPTNRSLTCRSPQAATAMSVPVLVAIGDPEGTRTVLAIVALLVAIGVALLLVAVWMYRTTRPDPDLLAPLEMMGERKWRRGDPVWQRRRLDALRPAGARPLEPSVAPPKLDHSFDAGPEAPGFDDLRPSRLVEPTWQAQRTAAEEGIDLSATPVEPDRPSVDDLSDDDFDHDALVAAREDLDRELAEREQQLDLFSEHESGSNN